VVDKHTGSGRVGGDFVAGGLRRRLASHAAVEHGIGLDGLRPSCLHSAWVGLGRSWGAAWPCWASPVCWARQGEAGRGGKERSARPGGPVGLEGKGKKLAELENGVFQFLFF
jgi:hypothetical protein